MAIVRIVSGIGCLIVGIAIGILTMTVIIPPTEISVITEKIYVLVETPDGMLPQRVIEAVPKEWFNTVAPKILEDGSF